MGVSFKFESHVNEVNNAVSHKNSVALELVGVRMERYAKLLCPVGTPESTGIPGYRGGTLRNSITHEVINKSIYIGSNVEYAPYQELGTIIMSAANGGRGYLRPALLDHIKEYRNIIDKVMRMG